MNSSFWSVHRSAIVDAWIARTFDEYPSVTRVLLRAETDPFRNPVGAAVRDALPRLYDQIVGDMDRDALVAALDDLIRIRAVQDLPAAEAAGFVLELKTIARGVAGDTRMTIEPAPNTRARFGFAERERAPALTSLRSNRRLMPPFDTAQGAVSEVDPAANEVPSDVFPGAARSGQASAGSASRTRESGRRATVADVCPGCGAGEEGWAPFPAGFRIAPSCLDTLEERIDRVALLAAEVLARCQQDLADVRANEARRQVSVSRRRLTKCLLADAGGRGTQAR